MQNGQKHREERDQQVDAPGVDRAREDVAAELVGPSQCAALGCA